MTQQKVLSLYELNRHIATIVQGDPMTQSVWVTAELSDVSVRGGHCYMELLQKDERGLPVAKARGMIWANIFGRISADFRAATGQTFATGLKVMLLVSASMHPVYGFSLTVSAVNPEYTMGDLLRRRKEILQRLQAEGILELNRQLQWPTVPQRIAVISAPGAAGYGDFINQLYNNPSRIRFATKLYPATMQGVSAPASIICALEKIAAEAHLWDGVVIIRGGGATSDLQAFEDYSLAASVAQFPLPVAIGIGHERDITVLDWVANTRLKTPTAVAEWLVARGDAVMGAIMNLAARILHCATDRMAGNKEQLAQYEALLPTAATAACQRAAMRLRNASSTISGLSGRIQTHLARLDMTAANISQATSNRLKRAEEKLNSIEQLLEVLSPVATLKRGYSITRVNGHAVTSVKGITPGCVIETTLADGTLTSEITQTGEA